MHSLDFNYILVTPAKNEEDNLPSLIRCITEQTIKPIVWFIVDDNSNDLTFDILSRAASEYTWIHVIHLDESHDYDLGEHYSLICIRGFTDSINYCNKQGPNFSYIAISDADIIYPNNYFEECIYFLANNKEYGIVSGNLFTKDKLGKSHIENELYDQPYGTGRVWGKDAFMETEGYLLTKSPDSVSNILATAKGWKIKRIKELVFYQTRHTSSKKGLWKGYLICGERFYYLHQNMLSMFVNSVIVIFKYPMRNGIVRSSAFFIGYLKSFILRKEQIDNPIVKKYLGSYKLTLKKYFFFLNETIKRKLIRRNL